MKDRLPLLALVVAVSAACAGPAASLPSPAPSATPIATVASTTPARSPATGSAVAMPIGYTLPGECRYVQGAAAPETWLLTCPQGLPSNYLAPSLAEQGWTACAGAPKSWRKDQLAIVITDFVNRSDASGQIEQRPVGTISC